MRTMNEDSTVPDKAVPINMKEGKRLIPLQA